MKDARDIPKIDGDEDDDPHDKATTLNPMAGLLAAQAMIHRSERPPASAQVDPAIFSVPNPPPPSAPSVPAADAHVSNRPTAPAPRVVDQAGPTARPQPAPSSPRTLVLAVGAAVLVLGFVIFLTTR